MQTIILLQKSPETLAFYQDKFQYIHVDEYQDTNQAQYVLVNMLAHKYKNICVVGDADQSIYGWRGANMENILNFEDDYPNAAVIKLEQNYRSTKNILKAANDVIENNELRKDKTLWTDNQNGEKIKYHRARTAVDEAYYVLKQIQANLKQGRNYGEMAILYRTNAQSRLMEDALMKANIPYKLVGAHKFYDRKEIKDILAYLRLTTNLDDSLSFERIVNEPKRGIGPTSLNKLYEFAALNGLSLLDAARDATFAGIAKKAASELAKFAQMITDLHDFQASHTLTEVIDEILQRSGYLAMLNSDKSLENQSRLENLEEFKTVTKQFETTWEPENEEADLFIDFLADLALVSDQDSIEENEQVTLMTLHAAKGLEFPIVFLMGLEEGIFPLGRAVDDQSELEEERRLAYVGITRAEELLYLTNATSRMLYGRLQNNAASRFIKEISADLIEADNQNALTATTRPTRRSLRKPAGYVHPIQKQATPAKPKTMASYQIGDKVLHKAWGEGTVVKTTGTGDKMELDVAFSGIGIKRLLVEFAPITKKE